MAKLRTAAYNLKAKDRQRPPASRAIAPLVSILIVGLIIIVAIVNTGKRDLLGPDSRYTGSLVFEGVNVDAIIAKQFGMRQERGVLVASEPAGHIAGVIGLKRGDIILALNDVPVNDVTALMDMMGSISSGAQAKFTITRNGTTRTLSSGPSLYSGYQTAHLSLGHIFFILAVFLIVFLLIFLDKVDRTVMVSLGAVIMVVFGTYVGFFDQAKAFSSINAGTLSLLVGMGFFSIFFEQTNFFTFTARKIALLSGGDKTKVILFLCSITYLFSMFVNNLSTILVIVPITFKIAEEFDLDIVPLLICEVIASNLGGASSMIGDFPNMLISSETKLIFHDFALFMFPICFIELLALFIYMRRKGWISDVAGKKLKVDKEHALVERLKRELKSTHFDKRAVKKGLVILSVVVVAFVLSDIIHIGAPTIALAGGFFLLAFGGVDSKAMLRKVNFRDILFFASLFVMVGALDSSGALNAVSRSVKFISGGNLLLQALLILWVSAFLTSFLNAGPATALFIPIIFRFGMSYPHDYIWWALSLGVLAGSCSTLTGATAGAVTVTLMEDYKDSAKGKNALGRVLSFKTYAEVGVPIMFLFLAISTVYITILSIF